MPLDEKALRREPFSDGVKVKLGDGQEWTFPRPRMRLFPRLKEDGTTASKLVLTHGKAFQEKLDSYFDVPQEDRLGRLEIQVTLAADLLLANYTLDDAALESLLLFDQHDEANMAMWDAISYVILSIPPKQ